MRFLTLILFLSASTVFAEVLECKITNDGEVALVHYLPASKGDIQQMVYNVGKETWQAPNVARPKCEQMKSKYTVYKGERWSEPYCLCRGNFRDKNAVFTSQDGEEIELKADNFFNNFRGVYSYDSFTKEVDDYVPNCEYVCWP